MSLASTILEELQADGTPGHRQISKVVSMCNDAVAKEKRDEITGSYWRLMERCEEYRTTAGDLSCYLDSMHEGWRQLIDEEKLGAEIVNCMREASNYASALENELEKIEDEYREKVNARLTELDPEEYPEEEE